LRRLLHWLRRRLGWTWRLPAGIDLAEHPLVVLQSTSFLPLGGDRFRLRGILTVGGLPRGVETEAEVAAEEGSWTARGVLALSPIAGVAGPGPPGILSRRSSQLIVDYELVATPVFPT
jgi:hypothetical protein